MELQTNHRISIGFAVDLWFILSIFNHRIGQVFFPNQANGDLVQLNGQTVGSNLIAQNFTLPIFFHTRNETASPSASGVDPDITLQDAYSQIPQISNATGIPVIR